MTREELQREYEQRIRARQQPLCCQADADWELLRYQKRLYEETGCAEVFGPYMAVPRRAGLALIFSFVREEVGPKELVSEMQKEVGKAYLRILEAAGVFDEVSQLEYDAMAAEVHLELLKACLPLRGLDPLDKSTCAAVAVAASTIWFRYVEQFHVLAGLPPVSKLWNDGGVVKLSPLEDEILKKEIFDAYAMVDEQEREKYRAMLRDEKA